MIIILPKEKKKGNDTLERTKNNLYLECTWVNLRVIYPFCFCYKVLFKNDKAVANVRNHL